MTSDVQQDSSKSVFLAPSASTESTSNAPCGICRRQFSRYTCPRCNLQYCSLTCFRSKAHSDCSEGFYKNELETDIRTNPSQTAEERRSMMELLKRFEEEAAEDEDALLRAEDDEDDENDLAQRLAALDLDDVSYDQLWEVLTPAERQKFLGALNDPSSEVAQSLLASDDLVKQIIQPWWDAPHDEHSSREIPTKHYGHRPSMLDLPDAVLHASKNASSTGPSLLFNVFAVLLAYSYVTRTLSISPLSSMSQSDSELQEAKRMMSELVPFLVDRKSTTVLLSLSGLITDLWSRFEPNTMTPTLFALLMRDAAKLLRPLSVVALSNSLGAQLNEHPSVNALLALSDVSAIFQSRSSETPKPSKKAPLNPTVAKLTFYAARIFNTPTSVLSALSDEATARADLIEREGIPDQDVRSDSGGAAKVGLLAAGSGQATVPRIVELS